MGSLSTMPNIGKVLEGELRAVGICDIDELKAIGSVKALLKINASTSDEGCLNKLYALEGAIQGIRWHELEKEYRDRLKNDYFARIGKE